MTLVKISLYCILNSSVVSFHKNIKIYLGVCYIYKLQCCDKPDLYLKSEYDQERHNAVSKVWETQGFFSNGKSSN